MLESVYGLHRNGIAATVERLPDHADASDGDVVAEALGKFRADSRVGFSDVLVLAIARKHGHLPLGSLGRNLARLDSVALP